VSRKKLTIWILTDESSKPKTFSISYSWVRAISFIALTLLVAVVAGVIDYLAIFGEAMENNRLRVENARLVEQFQVVDSKLVALETTLERVRTFTTKLRLITNLDPESRELGIAMGQAPNPPATSMGLSAAEESELPPEGQDMVEEIAQVDDVFLSDRTLDPRSNEVAATSGRDYHTLAIRIDRAIRDSELKEQSVLSLWSALSDRQSLLAATPNVRPTRGWITSRFGYRISPFTGRPSFHAGIDIAASPGTPIVAPADGIVSFVGFDQGYGKILTIDHGYGVTTRYGHASQIFVRMGQRVSRFDVVASVGSTGRSTGPHLHYEVRVNGVPRNPMLYILD
jgi:murein DD-endopeptidase MepM/ murein hydrolase activator NlpD